MGKRKKRNVGGVGPAKKGYERRFDIDGRPVPFISEEKRITKSKRDAKTQAESLRRAGHYVRILKEKGGYRVWYRNANIGRRMREYQKKRRRK